MAFLSLLFAVLLGACGDGSSIRTDCIQVRFDEYTENARNTDIQGVVLNDCQSAISRAKILAICYDFNGNALDDDSATVRNIEPGAKATFNVTVNASRAETAYCEPEVTSAKFK